MSELVPVLDKLVNASIVFGSIIVCLFMVALGVALALIFRTLKSIRDDEKMIRERSGMQRRR